MPLLMDGIKKMRAFQNFNRSNVLFMTAVKFLIYLWRKLPYEELLLMLILS